jgi:hypothetical protein
MKEDMTDKDDRLAAAFIEALSAKNIDRQRMHEIRQGHPKMSEAEVQMMFRASEMNDGYTPSNLAQAKRILSDAELALARTMQIIAGILDDRELMASAIELERRALRVIRRALPTLPERMLFVNWDYRPAVLVDGMAFAVIAPGEAGKRLSRHDVFGTASVMSEAAWRKAFSDFAPLDLSKIPDHSGDSSSRLEHAPPLAPL